MYCAKLYNHMFLRSTDKGFHLKACCLAGNSTKDYELNKVYVQNVEEIKNHDIIRDARLSFEKDIWPEVCLNCKEIEDTGKESSRQAINAFYEKEIYGHDANGYITNDFVDFDIRPSNICNLKCVMCNPNWSSKWEEDIEIAEKFNFPYNTAKTVDNIDYDHLLSITANKARRLSFLGGEPLYMKPAIKFIEQLSKNEWNRKNTLLKFVTNGVSFTDKIWKLLNCFPKTTMVFSCEGLGPVQEYIRFPSEWDIWISNFKKCLKHPKISPRINLTVGAMNYPIMQQTLDYFYGLHVDPKEITYFPLKTPGHLSMNALRPAVVREAFKQHKDNYLVSLNNTYKYNDKANAKLLQYLSAMDNKRNTDSRKILPWCYELQG